MRRLMEYKIISGRTVETRRSWLSIGPTYKKPRGTRKAGTSSLKKIAANERERIKQLARLINCNFGVGDGFLTLKYDDDHYPSDLSYETADAILVKFLRKLRREYRKESGKALPEVSITANWSPHRQAPARLHEHLVIPSDAVELARELWPEFGGPGTVIVKDLNDEGDYTKIAAYMIANVKGRPAGENTYHCSRGMARPIYTEPVEVNDVEDLRPDYGAIVKDIEETRDEDDRVVGKYQRCVWKTPPKVRGGQIILPKRGRRTA